MPDPVRSRAVLLGAAYYTDSELLDLPAVQNNLRGFDEILTSADGTALPKQHCVTLGDDRANRASIGAVLNAAAKQAEDLLLVYYAGHGLIGEDGALYLALPDTHRDREMVAWTALPFELLRLRLANARADNRVLILDCCFSGLAIDLMADVASAVSGQIAVAGTCTLTSSPANRPSKAPCGATYTAYTGELLDLLRHGSPDTDAELLTLTAIHEHLEKALPARGFPRPEQRNTRTIGRLALSRRKSRPYLGSVINSPEPAPAIEQDHILDDTDDEAAPDPIPAAVPADTTAPTLPPAAPEPVIETGPGWSWVRVDSPWSNDFRLRHKHALSGTGLARDAADLRFSVHETPAHAYEELVGWITSREGASSDRRELLQRLRQMNSDQQLVACCSHETVSPEVNPNFAPPALVYCVFRVRTGIDARTAATQFFLAWRQRMVEISPRSGRCIWLRTLREGWSLQTIPVV